MLTHTHIHMQDINRHTKIDMYTNIYKETHSNTHLCGHTGTQTLTHSYKSRPHMTHTGSIPSGAPVSTHTVPLWRAASWFQAEGGLPPGPPAAPTLAAHTRTHGDPASPCLSCLLSYTPAASLTAACSPPPPPASNTPSRTHTAGSLSLSPGSLSHRAALSPACPGCMQADCLSALPPAPSSGPCLMHKHTRPWADALYLSLCLPHTWDSLSHGKWKRVLGLMEAVILSPVTEHFHPSPTPSLPCLSPSPRDRAKPEACRIPHLWRGREASRGL